mgnify:CR=1 FL=1|tara:strand:+ start:291 stop:665 length:375 start_codon:yes stop_codon:yes gene_type:complete
MENKKKRKYDTSFSSFNTKKSRFYDYNDEIYRELHILKYQISQLKQNFDVKKIVEQTINSYMNTLLFNIDKEIKAINNTNTSLKNEILKINSTILELKNEIHHLNLMIDYKGKSKNEDFVSYIN